MTGTGEVIDATREQNPDVFDVARVGLGALGILTTVTFAVEPLFLLEAVEQPMSWDEALGSFDEMVAASDHCDMYWFPHTDRLLTKRNTRLDADVSEAEPVSRVRGWVDDELLSNTVFGMLTAGANRVPGVIPRMNQVSARVLSPRTYSDVAHRVFTSPRRVVFREMEYAVPREAGLDALREARQRHREVAVADQLPGRDPGRSRRTTSRCRRPPAATRSTSPSTPTTAPTGAPTRRTPRRWSG